MPNRFNPTLSSEMIGSKKSASILTLLFLIFFASNSFAQFAFGDIFGFGKNKVQYKTFDWSIIKTEHFNVYFYESERQAAMDAARIAERSYAYLSEVLDYQFKKKIPILLYASHNDFQQTNAIQGFISEGTQGVTESFKGRVILPITGSYAQFIHVLTHELVHAFQFDIMLADNPGQVVRRFNPPLWFVEGMAEYLSVGMDNITRMWMRDAVLNSQLLSIPEMAQVFDIRVYRMGQAIWYYVGERYGKKVVGRIFKTARATGDLNRAFKAHTGLDLAELSKRWHEDAQVRYLPEDVVLEKPVEVAEQLTKHRGRFSRLNIVPAISPDGRQLAYVGDKDFKLSVLLKTLDDKDDIDEIVESGSSESFHTLRYFDTSMNWSPDGSKFSFVSKAGANDAIYIVDARKQDVIKKLQFKDLTGLVAPSWSPDGKRLVFSGLSGGMTDLYIVNEDGSNLVRLTDDRYAYLHPQWSPDGKRIAFTTDRGPNTNVDDLIFGNYNIAMMDLETRKVDLLTQRGGNHINPVWSKNGERIIFVSDMTNIPNAYSIDLESREIYQITDFITGLSGIIGQSPAISLAPETGQLVFSAFWNAGWNIFQIPDYREQEKRIELPSIQYLEKLRDPNEKYLSYELPDSSESQVKDYDSSLSLDAVFGGGGFATNVGFAGQTALIFSDMLGDKNLIIQAALFGDPTESTIIASYLNQKHRVDYAFTGFQFRNDFGLFTAADSGGFVSQVFRGVAADASLPFSSFTRFEFGGDLTFVEEDVVNFSFVTFDTQDRDLGTALFGSVRGALVHDTSFFGIYAPVSGTRARLTATQAVGDLEFTNLILDYRKYIPIKIPRYSYAFRLVAGGSFGDNQRLFRIGGPLTFRGQDFGELFGTRTFFHNSEFRFPLLPFAPIEYDFLSAVAFFDAAHAWFDNDFEFNDIDTAFGFGVRLSLGGIFRLRWDFPIATDGPGTFFSIGFDY
ncbi:hypothetical protein GWO43_06990 [candidate division KSB1 bacterium]|nr:hypothetical protein [candidate division KSB1 bacterium]NIR72753.1 hypothetical protein [candidate division KSB1 bacterium]NIS23709.1 hypothetical protein [candidate division KSB1 bacterium]NIT70629.1 hypothetical protein [candidate division KSB1 bacterium]NIU24357.1 hypothetical protein [candidate division KSB1 bacterium]